MLTHYFPRSWWEMICSHILSDGQSVMNPACSFDVIHSTRILCTSRTFTFLQQKNCQISLEKDLISSWGLFEMASGTMEISFLFAPLESALQSWKGQYLKKKTALQMLCHHFYLDICKLLSESSILLFVRWYLYIFLGVREQNIFQNAFLSKI